MDPDSTEPISPEVQIVVAGVAGSGKSTIGAALADRLGRRFIDGDSLHSEANVTKMSLGQPLADADRWSWLSRIREELRCEAPVVIASSALKRSYRDILRHAPNTVFVVLDIDEETAIARLTSRPGHFMGAEMVQSQFAALQRPDDTETDVVTIDGSAPLDTVLDRVLNALGSLRPGTGHIPLVADGGVDRVITDPELDRHLVALVQTVVVGPGMRRVLLVPPDHTRLHSRAGGIAMKLRSMLIDVGCAVGVLPALGTHVPMGEAETATLFGDAIDADELLIHDWRLGVTRVGRIEADELAAITNGRYVDPIEIEVAAGLFDGWDLVISIGQVVPHEVIGMANFTKNIMVGLGGEESINRSHFVGAVAGMESIMGRTSSPVRDIVDTAFDRFVLPRLNVVWMLTVVEDTGVDMPLRGLFVGRGGSADTGGAAYRAAADLARAVNVDVVDEGFAQVVCWLDPAEMHSTWLGNKAIYRTRMAIADGGELVVLAPGVRRFGEDDEIDVLIRRHGYRGTSATIAAVGVDPELAGNLSAAAHLIHGSSEGRFRIVYCTDPDAGGLSEREVKSVGFGWRPLGEEARRWGVDPATPTGARVADDGEQFFYAANPALGLWSVRDRFEV